MNTLRAVYTYLPPFLALVLGLLVGLASERFFLPRIERLAHRTRES